jgi:type IV pilus assembly protein PilW
MSNPTRKRILSLKPAITKMSGFSMIEMMISITIGLLIVSGLVGMLISSSSNNKTNDRTAELQSNGRFALDHLKRVMREAGYRGYTAAAPLSTILSTPTITGECGIAGSFVKNIRQAVWGGNDNNPFSTTCIPAASYSKGDVLVTRNAASTPTLKAAAVPSALYVRSAYSGATLVQGSALPADVTGISNFALQEYVYYISPFTNSLATTGIATESPLVPALYRVALHSPSCPAATPLCMAPELVVTGIEQMQVQYGMSNADGTTQYFDAADTGLFVSATDHSSTAATNWDKISQVRIWLLARNSKADPDPTYVNTNSYEMGDLLVATNNPYTVNDHFRRQIFTSVVQLRNFRN